MPHRGINDRATCFAFLPLGQKLVMVWVPPLNPGIVDLHRTVPDMGVEFADVVVEISPVQLPDERLTLFLHLGLGSVVELSDADASEFVVST